MNKSCFPEEFKWSVPFPVDTNLRWIIATKEQCS